MGISQACSTGLNTPITLPIWLGHFFICESFKCVVYEQVASSSVSPCALCQLLLHSDSSTTFNSSIMPPLTLEQVARIKRSIVPRETTGGISTSAPLPSYPIPDPKNVQGDVYTAFSKVRRHFGEGIRCSLHLVDCDLGRRGFHVLHTRQPIWF